MTPWIVEQKIHQVLIKKTTLEKFEQWLYEDKTLEFANPDLYFKLISFDYSSENNFKDLYDSFARYVHFYKFEADRIAEYLYSIINRDEDCGKAIHEMYYLYYDDYEFFEKLGMIYGVFLIDFDTSVTSDNSDNTLDEFYPNIIDDAKNVLSWLDEGKIVFKDEPSEYGGFKYDDLRSEAEILQGKA
jgi:hypothetical protein